MDSKDILLIAIVVIGISAVAYFTLFSKAQPSPSGPTVSLTYTPS